MKTSIFGLLTLLVLSGVAIAHEFPLLPSDYSSWGNYRNVTLKTTGLGLSKAVTDFPILIRFTDASQPEMFSLSTAALPSGADIRVTKSDGVTDLPFEVDSWTTGVGGSGAIWVLADNIAQNQDVAYSVRVYWKKSGVTSASSPERTFYTYNGINTGYQAVFHLSDTSVNLTDAANNHTAVATGTTSAAGLIGNARTFNTATSGIADEAAATDYLTFTAGASDVLSTLTGPVTIEAWVNSSITNNSSTSAGTKQILSHGQGTTESVWLKRTGESAGNHYAAGGPAANINGPAVPTGEFSVWHYIAAVWDSTAWTVYRQRVSDPWGVPTGTSTGSVRTVGGGPTASTNPWFIGAWSGNGIGGSMSRPMRGSLDEVRISNVARDSNYIRLNFETQKAASTVVLIGASVPPPPTSIGSNRITANGVEVQSHGSLVLFHFPSGSPRLRLSVRDVSGQEVWNRNVDAGVRDLSWNGKTFEGSVATGVYLLRVTEDRSSKVLFDSKITLSP